MPPGSQSVISNAFNACVRADAALATIQVSGRGDVDFVFYQFYEAFKIVYMLALNNMKFREVRYRDGTLADAIQQWFSTAENKRQATEGLELFREFNLAMGRLGLLK